MVKTNKPRYNWVVWITNAIRKTRVQKAILFKHILQVPISYKKKLKSLGSGRGRVKEERVSKKEITRDVVE